MRLVFLGSPSVAVPFLEACAASGHEVALVVTQPDKPSGRGMGLTPPPVKTAALRLGLPVIQPAKMKDARAELEAAKADLAVVVAFGKIFKPEILALAKHGFMNVHFSLLPKYRGAAPLQWSLINGETRSGVTLFWITEGLDDGPIQSQAEAAVGADETAPELFERLIQLGTAELRRALSDVAAGKLVRRPQAGEPTFAPKLGPEIARLDFSMKAKAFHDRARGLAGGPKPYFILSLPGRPPLRVSVLKTSLGTGGAGEPGTVERVERSKGILVQCSDGPVWLLDVQPEGKKPQNAADFLNGHRLTQGDRLSAAAG